MRFEACADIVWTAASSPSCTPRTSAKHPIRCARSTDLIAAAVVTETETEIVDGTEVAIETATVTGTETETETMIVTGTEIEMLMSTTIRLSILETLYLKRHSISHVLFCFVFVFIE